MLSSEWGLGLLTSKKSTMKVLHMTFVLCNIFYCIMGAQEIQSPSTFFETAMSNNYFLIRKKCSHVGFE